MLDWSQVRTKENVFFVFIKATEGATHKDSQFRQNWAESKRVGLVRGAYHFFTLCRSGKDQFANLKSVVPRTADALPIAIDLEYPGNCSRRPKPPVLLRDLTTFIALTESHYGKAPILYVTRDFYADYLEAANLKNRLWVRNIFSEPNFGPGWLLWQYSEREKVTGIKGFVDINVLNGGPTVLKSLVKGG